MRVPSSGFVRAFLPVIALALCHGCSGGGDAPSTGQPAPAIATPANRAPTIDAVAATHARVGEAFVLSPVVEDADGDALEFTVENLPPWASFDESSGRIEGTPGAADVGEHESIIITVADASQRATTAPFSITVLGPITGSAMLRWEMPVSKFDGTPLDDLAGYRIMYGRDAADLDQSVFIEDPAQTFIELAGLETGTWHFAISAVNANGLEGPPTITATKTI